MTLDLSKLTSLHKDRYGQWGGNPKGRAADPTRCCVEVFPSERMSLHRQCDRKRGHGPEGAYCKQHSPEAVAERRAAQDAKFEKKMAGWRRQDAGLAALGILETIARGHNDPRSLALDFLRDRKVCPPDLMPEGGE